MAAPGLSTLPVRDFSGGPNLRDAPSQTGANELVDSWNMTFDRRGGASSRLGYVRYNATAFGGGTVSNAYWSPLLADTITQAGASLYKGTSTSAVKTFTTSARVGFCDFNGKVYVIHPVDGMFNSSDGVTWAALADVDAPKGNVLAVWQNKIFAAGNPTNGARVTWSDAGNGEAWTPASFVDLREKDNEQVVALAGAAGVDVQGRQGLLAFKQRSAYRIYDSATGAYQTIDASVGAASALSVVSVKGLTFAISERGIFYTTGNSPMKNASERFRPLWHRSQINMGQLPLMCAGRLNDRLYFSLPRAGSTANDLAIELDPETGSLAPASNAMSCYATATGTTERLYGGSPTVSGRVYELNTGGTDDGAAIVSRLQTRWFEPASGYLAQVWRIRVFGRGTPTVNFRADYATQTGLDYVLSLVDPPGITYDSGFMYDTGLLYVQPQAFEYVQDIHPSTACKAFSLVFTATTTTSESAPALLGVGSGPETGAWSLFGLDTTFVPLAVG